MEMSSLFLMKMVSCVGIILSLGDEEKSVVVPVEIYKRKLMV